MIRKTAFLSSSKQPRFHSSSVGDKDPLMMLLLLLLLLLVLSLVGRPSNSLSGTTISHHHVTIIRGRHRIKETTTASKTSQTG
jgi:hypothetical protein